MENDIVGLRARRVENGWYVEVNGDPYRGETGKCYVFVGAEALAQWISSTLLDSNEEAGEMVEFGP